MAIMTFVTTSSVPLLSTSGIMPITCRCAVLGMLVLVAMVSSEPVDGFRGSSAPGGQKQKQQPQLSVEGPVIGATAAGSESGTTSPSETSRRVRAGTTINLPCRTTSRSGDDHTELRGPSDRSRDVIPDQRARVTRVLSPSEASISAIIVGYEWRKDDEVIAAADTIGNGSDVTKRPGSSRFSIDRLNGSLTLRNVSSATDVGLYVCSQWKQRPGSDSGDVSVSSFQQQQQQQQRKNSRHIQLIVEDVPDPPVDVHWTVCDGRVVQLHWSLLSENYSPVQQFVIEYNTSFDSARWREARAQISRDTRYYRVALSPWADYSFRVVAENAIGRSSPSDPTSGWCTTPPDVPHIHPRAVCTRNGKPHTLVITWKLVPVEEHNGPGFYYVVKWRRLTDDADIEAAISSDHVDDEDSSNEFEERTIDAATDSLTLISQPVYKPFVIYVLAANEVGEAASEPAPIIGFSSESEPLEIPRNFRLDPNKLVTNSTADFIWDSVDPSPQRMQGFFRGYKIQFWKTREGKSSIKEHIIIYEERPPCLSATSHYSLMSSEGGATEHQFTGSTPTYGHVYNLWPATTITARIVAINGMYDGPPSGEITFVTSEGVPDPISDMKVVNRTSSHISIVWSRPTEINGILTGYQLTVTAVAAIKSRDEYRFVDLDGASITGYRLSGLRPDTLYDIAVCAATSAGCGTPAYIEIRTLPAGPPPVPAFSVVPISKRGLNVTWYPSQGGLVYASGTIFNILYRKRDESDWTVSVEERSPRSWKIVEGLSPEVIYEMKVVARNGGTPPGGAESCSTVERVRINMKRDLPGPLYKSVYDDDHSVALEVRLAHSVASVPVETYYVQYRPTGTTRWLRAEPIPRDQWAIIKHLERGRKYDIQVVAQGELGESSGKIDVIVAGSDPTAQASVGATSGSVPLLWQPTTGNTQTFLRNVVNMSSAAAAAAVSAVATTATLTILAVRAPT